MNKRQSRHFAIACTGMAALAFLVLTADSHRQFPELTNAENITPEVTRGKDVWHDNNCINCHTLFGEGAYYAPDLTKITQLRGAAYLQAYMKNPADFYDEATHRRLMPKQDLTDENITDLIAFLDWISQVDNQGWPPRPILVTGSSIPGTAMTSFQQSQPAQTGETSRLPPGARPVTAESNPIAQGEALFLTAIPACNACHSVAPGVNMAGPTLAGVATRALSVIQSPDYQGQAQDPESFIRESITEPSAHLAAGAMYSAGGTSFMPNTYSESLTDQQIDYLVAYLASLH
jgi:nitric oxide reductase subunit C